MNRRSRNAPPSAATIALLKSLERKRGTRDLSERFLIVCEDDKSAPAYFAALKRTWNLSGTKIQVCGSDGNTQPIQVVIAAIERKKRSRASDSATEPFDQVWCVIDGDYGSKIASARAKAKSNAVKIAVTTKCFEYWILLHFQEHGKPAHKCDEITKLLRPHIKNYKKGTCTFEECMTCIDLACERSDKIRKSGLARNVLPENQNPCSELHIMIGAIRKAMVKDGPAETGAPSNH